MILGVTRRHYMSVSVVHVKPVKPPRRRKYGICNPSSKRCVQHNMKAHTKTKQIPELPMSGPMRAIHSLAAAPAAPAPATETATRPLRRRTSAARASRSPRGSRKRFRTSLCRAALLALVLAGSTPRPPTAAAAFSSASVRIPPLTLHLLQLAGDRALTSSPLRLFSLLLFVGMPQLGRRSCCGSRRRSRRASSSRPSPPPAKSSSRPRAFSVTPFDHLLYTRSVSSYDNLVDPSQAMTIWVKFLH